MNHLYYGDNLDILRRYVQDETVDLCYIDPPFNSKRNYNQLYNNLGKEDKAQAQAFVDTWTWDTMAEQGLSEILSDSTGRFTRHTVVLLEGLSQSLGKGSLMAYLISMTLRIAEIHRVLKPTGSFYLHCDPSASHYLKIILDSIFCARQGEYQNELIWKRTNAHNDAKQGRKAYGNITDTILFYTKSARYTYNTVYTSYTDEYIRSTYNHVDDDGRRWKSSDLSGPGGAAKGNPYFEFLGVSRYWRYSVENLNKLLEAGRIYQSKPGTVPRLKHYLDEMPGIPAQNLWDDIAPLSAHARERLGYPTQKPESLLERIIKTSSNEGDTVLDAYCGCGTTVAVSQRLNRQWIGVDITYQSISLILKRLEDSYGVSVVKAVKLNGVPKDFEAAVSLARRKDDRIRKEFEKWAVLTFSQNRAIINEKKGGDGGIDGTAFVLDTHSDGRQSMRPIIFSVKSGETLTPAVVRELYGTVERERAAMGYLLTLNPMENLVRESKKYGFYTNAFFGSTYPKIEVISVMDILNGERIRVPLNQRIEVVKSAQEKVNAKQLGMF